MYNYSLEDVIYKSNLQSALCSCVMISNGLVQRTTSHSVLNIDTPKIYYYYYKMIVIYENHLFN